MSTKKKKITAYLSPSLLTWFEEKLATGVPASRLINDALSSKKAAEEHLKYLLERPQI